MLLGADGCTELMDSSSIPGLKVHVTANPNSLVLNLYCFLATAEDDQVKS